MLLALLRAFTLSLLLLLLFDPVLPSAARPLGGNSDVVIVDASLSMELPGEAGKTRWQSAIERARRASGRSIMLMGGVPRRITPDSLDLVKPDAAQSRLLPALQAASEGGSGKAIVITDGAIEDLQEVERWLPRLGLQLEVQNVGAATFSDRVLSEVNAPAWVEAGKPVEIQVGASVIQAGTEPMRVTARSGNVELGEVALMAPGEGRVTTGTISITPPAPPGGGLVRIDVQLEGQDAVPANDRRSVYVLVGAKPAGVALISFAPDWEPRFLQPVLEQSIGLPVRSFYRAGNAGFVTGGVPPDIGKRVTDEEAITAARSADLLVIHGASASLPQWAREAMLSRPRVLILPRENGIELPDIDIGQATPGDWYVSADIPSSPVASLLAGLPIENLPPLAGLHLPRTLPNGAWVPMQGTRGRRGAPSPIAFATAEGGKRRVVALGQGYWKWSFRGGEQRQVYARLWGALAGWLAQEQTMVAGGAVRPGRRVLTRGERPTWIASGLSADSLRVQVLRDGATVAETTIPVEAGDSAFSPVLEPGHYQYRVSATAGGREVGTGAGPLTVETFTPELTRPSRALSQLVSAAQTQLNGQSRAGSRPLRTMVWPYALVVALLAAEWVLRRRWGLR